MAEITVALIKQLREQTGAGMSDCKKALVAAGGDLQKAVDEMRKNGVIKAAKKAGRVAAEGIIALEREGSRAVLVEFNSETDFVSKNPDFIGMGQKLAQLALKENISKVEDLHSAKLDGQSVDEQITALVAKIGEDLQLRRMAALSAGAGEILASYVHFNRRIGVLCVLKGGDEELANQLAMHICAAKPEFLKPEDVSAELLEHERTVQEELIEKDNADPAKKSIPPERIPKVLEGRLNKYRNEIALTGQAYMFDTKKTVGELLKAAKAEVLSFVCLEVGAGVEKKQEDFAAEVQAQIDAAKR